MSRSFRPTPSLVVISLTVAFAAIACGNSDDGSPKQTGGASGSAGSSSTAGKASGGGGGSSNGGSSNGGSNATAGKPATAGSAGQATAGSGNNEGGSGGGAGEGSGGAANPGEAGAGGGPTDDPRPGCAKVPGIELSNFHLVQGAGPGETAMLEVDAKNGTDEFVSYNPVKITCTGDAVESASDQISVFGVSQGETMTVDLRVTFKDDAQAGDVASCTVRGFILGQSPEDCQNAQTLQLDVTVE
jgi:hypothetical protein